MKPLRVVLDTNLLVSYLLTQGKTIARIIDFWEAGDLVLIVSPAMVEELTEVVQRSRIRHRLTVDPQFLLDLIASEAIQTSGALTLPGASRDPKDDKFLACAVEGAAGFIVTGDHDLLVLESFENVSIVRPYDFVQMMETGNYSEQIE